jgi:hypothetical protein
MIDQSKAVVELLLKIVGELQLRAVVELQLKALVDLVLRVVVDLASKIEFFTIIVIITIYLEKYIRQTFDIIINRCQTNSYYQY